MRFATRWWPRSLRSQLLLAYAFGLVFSALLVGALLAAFALPLNRYLLESGAVDDAYEIVDRIVFDEHGVPVGIDETRIERWIFSSLHDEVTVRVADATGKVIFSPTGETSLLAPDGRGFDPGIEGFALEIDGVPAHVGMAPVRRNGKTWYVQLAINDRFVMQMRNSVGMPVLYRGALLICLTFLGVFLLTTHVVLPRVLRPLEQTSRAAQRITPQTLDARLDARHLPDDISPLVLAFNQALERLQAGFRVQQEFLAQAAHELKTPLSLIRAQLELNPRSEANRHLIQDVDRMARQVQQLLLLAEASELHNYRIEDVEPMSVVNEVCGYMAHMAERHGMRIECGYEGDASSWQADRGALFTLIKNLLENAIQHSPVGGLVTLAATPAGFVVADQGPGVDPDDLDKIFQRFWRGSARRDIGSGLGLALCKEIAQAHGWQIAARQGTAGLEVEVSMRQVPVASEIAIPTPVETV